jgi:hypothetical protein
LVGDGLINRCDVKRALAQRYHGIDASNIIVLNFPNNVLFLFNNTIWVWCEKLSCLLTWSNFYYSRIWNHLTNVLHPYFFQIYIYKERNPRFVIVVVNKSHEIRGLSLWRSVGTLVLLNIYVIFAIGRMFRCMFTMLLPFHASFAHVISSNDAQSMSIARFF